MGQVGNLRPVGNRPTSAPLPTSRNIETASASRLLAAGSLVRAAGKLPRADALEIARPWRCGSGNLLAREALCSAKLARASRDGRCSQHQNAPDFGPRDEVSGRFSQALCPRRNHRSADHNKNTLVRQVRLPAGAYCYSTLRLASAIEVKLGAQVIRTSPFSVATINSPSPNGARPTTRASKSTANRGSSWPRGRVTRSEET